MRHHLPAYQVINKPALMTHLRLTILKHIRRLISSVQEADFAILVSEHKIICF